MHVVAFAALARDFTSSRRGVYTSLTATISNGTPELWAESSSCRMRPPAPITPIRSRSFAPHDFVEASAVSPPAMRKLRRLSWFVMTLLSICQSRGCYRFNLKPCKHPNRLLLWLILLLHNRSFPG